MGETVKIARCVEPLTIIYFIRESAMYKKPNYMDKTSNKKRQISKVIFQSDKF